MMLGVALCLMQHGWFVGCEYANDHWPFRVPACRLPLTLRSHCHWPLHWLPDSTAAGPGPSESTATGHLSQIESLQLALKSHCRRLLRVTYAGPHNICLTVACGLCLNAARTLTAKHLSIGYSQTVSDLTRLLPGPWTQSLQGKTALSRPAPLAKGQIWGKPACSLTVP